VFRGVPFQKTTASVPKLLPLIVMLNGTLLTGTLSGVNVVIAGGENTTALNGSLLLLTPLPHPMVSRLASTRLTYRIATSCRFRKMPTRRNTPQKEKRRGHKFVRWKSSGQDERVCTYAVFCRFRADCRNPDFWL
jgi:hypothetical protein